ncbi:hypothetical protein FB451DRAFT_1562423, partial [Mycena latifolia]
VRPTWAWRHPDRAFNCANCAPGRLRRLRLDCAPHAHLSLYTHVDPYAHHQTSRNGNGRAGPRDRGAHPRAPRAQEARAAQAPRPAPAREQALARARAAAAVRRDLAQGPVGRAPAAQGARGEQGTCTAGDGAGARHGAERAGPAGDARPHAHRRRVPESAAPHRAGVRVGGPRQVPRGARVARAAGDAQRERGRGDVHVRAAARHDDGVAEAREAHPQGRAPPRRRRRHTPTGPRDAVHELEDGQDHRQPRRGEALRLPRVRRAGARRVRPVGPARAHAARRPPRRPPPLGAHARGPLPPRRLRAAPRIRPPPAHIAQAPRHARARARPARARRRPAVPRGAYVPRLPRAAARPRRGARCPRRAPRAQGARGQGRAAPRPRRAGADAVHADRDAVDAHRVQAAQDSAHDVSPPPVSSAVESRSLYLLCFVQLYYIPRLAP